jgi:hypothetical protein
MQRWYFDEKKPETTPQPNASPIPSGSPSASGVYLMIIIFFNYK